MNPRELQQCPWTREVAGGLERGESEEHALRHEMWRRRSHVWWARLAPATSQVRRPYLRSHLRIFALSLRGSPRTDARNSELAENSGGLNGSECRLREYLNLCVRSCRPPGRKPSASDEARTRPNQPDMMPTPRPTTAKATVRTKRMQLRHPHCGLLRVYAHDGSSLSSCEARAPLAHRSRAGR